MIHRITIGVLISHLILATLSSARCEQARDDSLAAGDSTEALSADAFVFRPNYDLLSGKALTLSMRPEYNTRNMFGFEVYKASRLECALYGAGAGASLGMATGAFGMMTGTWDERTAWYITGAMAAFGAVFGGGIKADDPGWNLRIRWDPDR